MVKKKEGSEDIILKVKTSRKLYLPFYLMVLFLIGLLIFLYFKGYDLNNLVLGVSVVFIVAVFNLTETHRMGSSYSVTKNDVTCKYGILNKRIVKLDYYAISDMVVDQGFWQWLFGYGDIEIKLFSKENSVSIKNINKPSKFVREVEKVMVEKRK